MLGESIYIRGREAFTGGSPQAVYEELWQRGRKARLRTRAFLAVATLLLCGMLVNPVFGVVMAVLVASADALVHWRLYNASRVWRRGRRGVERMDRTLRLTLERRGHRVLHGRVVPGHEAADELVVGPGGVWLVHNEAWAPDAEIDRHGGRLFVNGRTQSRLVGGLTARADAAGRLISERYGAPVTVTPVLAVHGGKLARAPFTADGIVFAPPLRLIRWMRRNPSADRSPEEVEAIARAAVHALPIGGRTMTDPPPAPAPVVKKPAPVAEEPAASAPLTADPSPGLIAEESGAREAEAGEGGAVTTAA
ncbi:NERD domain-containing protein [Actinomadura opuntiae]|uniref:NERD domain-containing protein n=1 Tax=Actinomadura sp. OS1-43 TaxID=604315 RepID=UPI00255B1156|nr:NERD domain-containing protein [Actinomadura sp. OS1-43]MDL4820818.1 NERD domain-containing protein [Actinomadura sp. OS1-43]